MENDEIDVDPIFVVCRPNYIVVSRGSDVLGSFAGPEAEARACLFRRALCVQEGIEFAPAAYQRIGDPLGAIFEGHHDSEGISLLRRLVTSIGVAKLSGAARGKPSAVWDHSAMFELRDFLDRGAA